MSEIDHINLERISKIDYWKELLEIDANLPLREDEKPHEREYYRKMLSREIEALEEKISEKLLQPLAEEDLAQYHKSGKAANAAQLEQWLAEQLKKEGASPIATNAQVRDLLKSHYEQDDLAFTTIALIIGAKEAKKGRESSARNIRDLVDNRKEDGGEK